ncbi:putative bifunctional diguanylate cyclase/phosphodiesterase [Kineococcus radiotolerans]|uniref:Diguanylate cyclase/phosphodiesterase n=1 Tax=Kineococcus radiotolerans (strain ATCC BAA-149 / DSM 14245 / SRS30216) TaxID=266940 RepID=A6W440_KINRD|nr:bifunctional diguanylate cyclase/phosphodiesterase [Kineococcus radiotolerans]ABS01579.1 diguanylate cyclase/phosphodiesterase [Kineococcus radiotolerans SRS30216 = ATCC BAA-149]
MTFSQPRPRTRVAAVCLAVLAVGSAFAPVGATASAGLLAVAHLTAVAVLALGARRRADDGVWRSFAVAGALVGVPPVLALVTGGRSLTPLGGCLVVAMPFLYQALVRWNRYRTYVSDPGDWLNWISAVLACAGAGLLVQDRVPFLPAAWPSWMVQLWLLVFGSLLILLGTAVTVAWIGGLLRDRRVWLVVGALGALTVVSGTLRGDPADALHGQAAWTLAFLVIAFASTRGGRHAPVPATSQAPAIGALVVLALAVGVLVVDGHEAGWVATAYAGVAVLGVSVRVVHLVRELAQLAESRQQALTDELTGVGNRRALLRVLGGLVADGRSAALLLLDVDRFKEVNDRQGHHAGDDLLRRVVAATRRALPADAVLTRTGGDEFAVVLPDRDEASAVEVARAVHAAVVADAEIGLSVGVRSLPAGGFDPDRLLRQADTAMYAAKTAGGGVSVYDVDVDARLRDRAALAADLKALVAAGEERLRREVVVHYQPQLDVGTGRVVGAEALVRWQHPQRGLLPPVAFLDLVEEQGLMDDLTEHLLHRASADAAGWSHRGSPLRISVNLSASSLTHPGLLGLVDDVLERSGLAAGRLVLEVTETTLMADPDLALAVTRELTRRGVQLSIDDYGTGYSSLAYLTDLPATELKLDRAFTARVLAEPRTAEIVEATVALAHRLGLRVVAEGVEDESTRAALGGLDVDESQGYLHSRPLPPAAFAAWLAAAGAAQVVGAAGSTDAPSR